MRKLQYSSIGNSSHHDSKYAAAPYHTCTHRNPPSYLLTMHWSEDDNVIPCIYENLDKYVWDWRSVTLHPAVKFQDIIENPSLSWDYYVLHYKPDFNIGIVNEMPRNDWDWPALCREYGDEAYDIMQTHKDVIDWQNIHRWVGLDWNKVFVFIPGSAFRSYAHTVTNITPEMLLKFLDKGWHHSVYYKLDYRLVAQNPDLNWNWGLMSRLCNVNWLVVAAFPKKHWDWNKLSKQYDAKIIAKKYWKLPWRKGARRVVKRVAVNIIENAWYDVISCPYTYFGKRRLQREFKALTKDEF